jgi:hypothetical protein
METLESLLLLCLLIEGTVETSTATLFFIVPGSGVVQECQESEACVSKAF